MNWFPFLNDWPAVSVAGIVARIPLLHPAVVVLMMLRRGWRIVRMLRRGTGSHHAGRLRVVAAGTASPQGLGTIVEMIRGCGSLHHQVEDRRAAHHLDRPLERKIGKSLTIAPDYYVAGLQARRARGPTFPRALNGFYKYNYSPSRSPCGFLF